MSTTATTELADRLTTYAARLRADGAIRTDAVEQAFATVQRHRCLQRFRFGPAEHVLEDAMLPAGDVLDLIYADHPLVTHTGRDGDPPSSSSAPSLMARMLEELHLRPGDRVLEIGAGTGYNAALIAHITGAEVTTVEAGAVAAAGASASIRALGLDEQVHVVHGDGYAGHPVGGPYDRIIVTCGIAGIPPHWLDQLAPDGLILAPVAHAGLHPIVAARRVDGGELAAHVVRWGDFMPAAGHLRPAELFAHDPADPVPAEAVREVGGIGTALTTAEYQGLWMYLGIEDKRITRAYLDGDQLDPRRGACALVHPTDGAAWIHHDGAITLAGPQHLAGRLVRLAAHWDVLDRPAATAWRIDLRHADTGGAGLLLPRRWHLAPLAE